MTTLILCGNIASWSGLTFAAIELLEGHGLSKRQEAACMILCMVSAVMALANLALVVGGIK